MTLSNCDIQEGVMHVDISFEYHGIMKLEKQGRKQLCSEHYFLTHNNAKSKYHFFNNWNQPAKRTRKF